MTSAVNFTEVVDLRTGFATSNVLRGRKVTSTSTEENLHT
jgi:hypothetical protein